MVKITNSIENKIKNSPQATYDEINPINTQTIENNINVLNIEKTEIESVPLTLSGAVTSFPLKNNEIDFSRIAFTPEAVQSKEFVNENIIPKENWNENLNFQIGSNNCITIYNGNTIIGFTDPLGIAPLVNHEVLTPINNQNQNTSVDPTIQKGLHKTKGNTTYQLTEEQLKKISCVIELESNGTYEDALGVASVIANRMEDPRYQKYNYTTPIDVIAHPGQFAVWSKIDSMRNSENPEVLRAINDCFQNGLRNNDYTEFKSSSSSNYSLTGEEKIQLVPDGNKYHNPAISLDRTTNAVSNIDTNINPQ